MNTKRALYQVSILLIFGILAYITRAFNLITPLGDVFVLDLRDFFVAIGAAIGGPIAGFGIGILAGLPARYPQIDVTSFALAGVAVGFFSSYFYQREIRVAYSAAFMLCGYFVALVLVILFGMWKNVPFLFTRAVICTPLNIFILNNLFSTHPNILAIARYSSPPTEEKSKSA